MLASKVSSATCFLASKINPAAYILASKINSTRLLQNQLGKKLQSWRAKSAQQLASWLAKSTRQGTPKLASKVSSTTCFLAIKLNSTKNSKVGEQRQLSNLLVSEQNQLGKEFQRWRAKSTRQLASWQAKSAQQGTPKLASKVSSTTCFLVSKLSLPRNSKVGEQPKSARQLASWRAKSAQQGTSKLVSKVNSTTYFLASKISSARNSKAGEQGLPYEYRAVDLVKGEQFTPGDHVNSVETLYQMVASVINLMMLVERFQNSKFEKLNPLHFVPVLADGDLVVSDSFAILLYLEEKYPQNALLPADPRLKALNLQAASIVSSSIQPLIMMSMQSYDFKLLKTSVIGFSITGFILCTALEKLLKDSSGKYATGDKVYMADVFLAPQIAIAAKRFNIDMSKFPTLSMIFESCKALPEFQASLPDRQPDAM
ncbi:hypothetical protein TEA_016371 [Camellia sinensis var. sinensis]|uniref:GST N-terminal domain-containing protein n=1 Tax=Camellia sinensis var. sinensis TaxID=542762 RepID=A0A4S4D7M8_CAMSN|nr:hypothetical protein TEA_016371 [Camellia sinensis var. sinensis]